MIITIIIISVIIIIIIKTNMHQIVVQAHWLTINRVVKVAVVAVVVVEAVMETEDIEEKENAVIEIAIRTVPVGRNSSSSQQWLKQ